MHCLLLLCRHAQLHPHCLDEGSLRCFMKAYVGASAQLSGRKLMVWQDAEIELLRSNGAAKLTVYHYSHQGNFPYQFNGGLED